MTADEREEIRRAVVRYSIDGSEDFEQVNHVDRTWRREKLRRG